MKFVVMWVPRGIVWVLSAAQEFQFRIPISTSPSELDPGGGTGGPGEPEAPPPAPELDGGDHSLVTVPGSSTGPMTFSGGNADIALPSTRNARVNSTVYVFNNGSEPVNTRLAVAESTSGPQPDLTSSCSLTGSDNLLAPGEHCSVSLSWTPTAAGDNLNSVVTYTAFPAGGGAAVLTHNIHWGSTATGASTPGAPRYYDGATGLALDANAVTLSLNSVYSCREDLGVGFQMCSYRATVDVVDTSEAGELKAFALYHPDQSACDGSSAVEGCHYPGSGGAGPGETTGAWYRMSDLGLPTDYMYTGQFLMSEGSYGSPCSPVEGCGKEGSRNVRIEFDLNTAAPLNPNWSYTMQLGSRNGTVLPPLTFKAPGPPVIPNPGVAQLEDQSGNVLDWNNVTLTETEPNLYNHTFVVTNTTANTALLAALRHSSGSRTSVVNLSGGMGEVRIVDGDGCFSSGCGTVASPSFEVRIELFGPIPSGTVIPVEFLSRNGSTIPTINFRIP